MKSFSQLKLSRVRDIPLRPALEYYGLNFNRRDFALCPFHAEHTPSFLCRPSDAHWKCFGCQESGDLITFVRKSFGLSFPDAVERIALDWHLTDERPTLADMWALDEQKIRAAARKRELRRAEEEYLDALDRWLTSIQKLELAKDCNPLGKYMAELRWEEIKARYALELAEMAQIKTAAR